MDSSMTFGRAAIKNDSGAILPLLEIAFVPMNFDQLAGFNVKRGSQHQVIGSRTARLR
jgi:hypothetical protein